MPYEFTVQRRVEFSETDLAGIVHFSNFFRYMEAAEHAFYRSLGFSATLDHLDPPLGLPRVRVECEYRHPLRFEDTVEVHMLVKAKRAKVITYLFRFGNLSATPVVQAAHGSMTVVCVVRQRDGSFAATGLPAEIASRIEVAPAELLEHHERHAPRRE